MLGRDIGVFLSGGGKGALGLLDGIRAGVGQGDVQVPAVAAVDFAMDEGRVAHFEGANHPGPIGKRDSHGFADFAQRYVAVGLDQTEEQKFHVVQADSGEGGAGPPQVENGLGTGGQSGDGHIRPPFLVAA
jgi:hypothetical protein